jgi:hypothetical protein
MVDPDNPPPNASDPNTVTFLHWIQPGLVSANTPSTIDGTSVYQLTNPNNVSAFAPYLPAGPPFEFPFVHRYIQLLLNTTSMPNNSVLATAAETRTLFNTSQVINDAGVSVVAGNWYFTSNLQALVGDTNGIVLGNGNGNSSATVTQTCGPATTAKSGAGALTGWKGVGMGCVVLVHVVGRLLS